MKKNILVISPFLPWPLNAGGNIGIFYMLEYVSKYENIYFLTSYNMASNNYKNFNTLKDLLPNVHFLIYDYRKTTYIKYEYARKIIRHIGAKLNFGLSKCSMSTLNVLEGITPGFIDYVNNEIISRNINIVQIELLGFHPLIYCLPNMVKKIFIHHELGWVRNELSYGSDLYSVFAKRYLKDEEIATLNNYDIVATLTEVDKKKLIEAGLRTKAVVSTLAVSNKTLEKKDHVFKGNLTFIGGSGHYPNFNGIEWFVANVLPLVTKNNHDIKLKIIGKWSEASIKSIHSICKDVLFKGFVDNLGNELQNSIMIVPINIGSGMRMKILEAANYSVPFVSTIVGVEGLDFENNRDCFISESASDMSEQILQLADDNNLYQRFSFNSHLIFIEKYSIESLGKKRLSLYE